MSYCGACGKFFSPGCPRAAEGLCTPAPNPYEMQAAALLAQAMAIFAETCGMLAQNQRAIAAQDEPPFDEEDFGALADGLRAIMRETGI